MAAERALKEYRVVDLMEEGSGLCAKLLADWGAEVVKVEPPGGSRLRNIGPFYHDHNDPEKSLFWFAFNTGKKSITLNISINRGQEILRQLVKGADFLVESFHPGYLDSLGLGYSSLHQLNPRLIVTSITPFGQSGPYAKYKSCEMALEAMGGIMYNLGTPDRPPIRPMTCRAGSVACLMAEVEAAGGSLIANYYRLVSGKGQHVDVSIQECISNLLMNPPIYWDTSKIIMKRVGGGMERSSRGVKIRRKAIFPCKDGHVQALIFGDYFEPMVEWLDSEGAAQDLKQDEEKWKMRFSTSANPPLSQEEVNHVDEVLAAFLAKHTKAEIYKAAEARGIGWTGVHSIGEVVSNEQLKSRAFFSEVDHPELGEALIYPRPPFRATETPPSNRCRAPLIGEHNEEVYVNELGFSQEKLASLKECGAI